MTNREVAEKIVANICNALNLLPDKDDWKKLIDFTEHHIDRQCAAQHPLHLTLGESAASDGESKPTPKRLI